MEEDKTWNQTLQALTHTLTSPTTTPSLHSQFLISTTLPSYTKWDHYPPAPQALSTSFHHWAFGFSLYLKRVSRFCLPETSWRCKCPYQQPPPLILAEGLEEAKWGEEEKREYFRRRLRRKRLGSDVHPLIPVLVPNLLLFSLLLWNPFTVQDRF